MENPSSPTEPVTASSQNRLLCKQAQPLRQSDKPALPWTHYACLSRDADASHGEAVKIIVNKYQYSQHNQWTAEPGSRGFDFPSPTARKPEPPARIHQALWLPNMTRNIRIYVICRTSTAIAILKNVGDSAFKLKAGIKQSSHPESPTNRDCTLPAS